MRTNIYNVTCDNGDRWEHPIEKAETIAAQNEIEAIEEFRKILNKETGEWWENFEARLVFENVILDATKTNIYSNIIRDRRDEADYYQQISDAPNEEEAKIKALVELEPNEEKRKNYSVTRSELLYKDVILSEN